ncbi:DUF4168 domain-containing protein [Gloeocapsopsis dulcis]|uniref:DUF4168 domain-containing protein n=1 Tax=Gloeocapsopsis dulcis AAB1 = 1H9 TaxID=1433147 RepID=A0A6N8FYX6_9CHRO|nr:DUF4168 domain-containing protein [Gloeocapsopsis dulcis]MUL37126.1 hypothetical protein [Gloeocapsopsis dulcis AAB1 = 1H9]WNN88409.1 DUF4168 domain-containing protein [Gloeocapsopsis dulcis]
MISYWDKVYRSNRLSQMLSRSLIVATISSVSVFSGLVPNLAGARLSEFSSVAYAQAVSNAEVTQYARSVLVMEPVRQTAFNEIKRIIASDNVPAIVCNQPRSFSSLPPNARNIAVDFCKRSRQIVESNGLPIDRFNAITVNLQNDANLERRVKNELLRLQNTSAN